MVLANEILSHKRFSITTLGIGLALILGGIVGTFYYAPLGWLLIFFGVLRVLNSTYDMRRKDELERKLHELDREFGRG